MTASTLQRPAPNKPARRPGSNSRSRGGAGPATYFIAIVLVTVMLIPILYIILGGFRTNSQITTDPAGLPSPWKLTNYVGVLTNPTFWREVGNSTFVALFTAAAVVA